MMISSLVSLVSVSAGTLAVRGRGKTYSGCSRAPAEKEGR